MKTEVSGQNSDGSDHIVYIPEGFSATMVHELWCVAKKKGTKYPLSVQIGTDLTVFANVIHFRYYIIGLQQAFELCSL